MSTFSFFSSRSQQDENVPAANLKQLKPRQALPGDNPVQGLVEVEKNRALAANQRVGGLRPRRALGDISNNGMGAGAPQDENAKRTKLVHKPEAAVRRNSFQAASAGALEQQRPPVAPQHPQQLAHPLQQQFRAAAPAPQAVPRPGHRQSSSRGSSGGAVAGFFGFGSHGSSHQAAQEDSLAVLEKESVSMMMELDDDDLEAEDAFMMGSSAAGVKAVDLDAVDAEVWDDPLYVAEYANDIVANMRVREQTKVANPHYMDNQSDLNPKFREVLIDWMTEVHIKFKLSPETMYLAVNILDRFLERRAVSRSKLQLVGCAALLLASKYQEIWAPEVNDFVYITEKTYRADQILAMEIIVLDHLQYCVTVPSSLQFSERYLQVARADELTTELCHYIMESTHQRYNFLQYLPSLISSAAIYLARKIVGVNHEPLWTAELQAHTKYSEADLLSCAREMWMQLKRIKPESGPSRYKSVSRKYSSAKRSKFQVAKLPIGECP